VGAFTLTTARGVFVGSKQTREWAWDKLISVTHASDATWTVLPVSNRQKASGIAYNADTATVCRFWIDFAVARATGSVDQFIVSCEAELAIVAPPQPPRRRPPRQSLSHNGRRTHSIGLSFVGGTVDGPTTSPTTMSSR
jgi:hypothetical protein